MMLLSSWCLTLLFLPGQHASPAAAAAAAAPAAAAAADLYSTRGVAS